MSKILILLTNHGTLAGEANGTYAPELTHALHAFIEGGYDYDLVSINGGAAPIYGEDVVDPVNQSILSETSFQKRLASTLAIKDIKAADYCAVFYPGGYGLLFDLNTDPQAAKITAALYDSGAIVGAVCHGPAGLLPVVLANGQSILNGKAVTSFTREEEVAFGTITKIPYVLEESLMDKGARFTKVKNWGENLVVDDRLITGQNPGSAAVVGKAMVQALKGN